ncbi:pentatricopeptide repeat-containing protein At1g07740, mitochondrial [Salvia miltiorrhiza]|uniref:pentatricopeptide repeat-containing protein At1g07740, mitochondrial n=1 Tax=Salvia miltiorrhiza TaxID=226208 RepID=UPI0025ABC386|nr:pentatricopeptide repeat-containing protein At1g07740, mitochondrial [Salvia miltiorrhiza]
MINPRFKLATFKLQNQLHKLIHSNHIHGNARIKPRKAPRPHKFTRNQLRPPIPFLDHLKQCTNPDEFLSAFNDFNEMGYKHDYPSYASLIYKLARARRFDDVDAVLDYIRSRDIRCGEPMFIGLIRHYGKADLIDKAIETFREMGKSYNCARTTQSFNTILNVLVDGGRIPDAIELFAKGPKMGFRLNSVSYNVMIKMWLGNNDWENAMKVFDEMLEREVEPTFVTYNSQIGFLCKRGEIDEAKGLFEGMRGKGRRGNAVTYALLMEGLCSSGRFNEAKKLMFDMEYHGCKAELVNYGVLMSDLCKRGLIDEAKGLLLEMKRRRIKPDVVMYNILIGCLCKDGAVLEGYKLLVEMQVKGLKPNAATYRMVVDGFVRVEDFAGGLKVFNAMLHSNHAPRLETFRCLCSGLLRRGRMDEGGFVLEEMKKRKMSLGWDLWEVLASDSCKDDGFAVESLSHLVASL